MHIRRRADKYPRYSVLAQDGYPAHRVIQQNKNKSIEEIKKEIAIQMGNRHDFEFRAYMNQHNFEKAMGMVPQFKDKFEIMAHIRRYYPKELNVRVKI